MLKEWKEKQAELTSGQGDEPRIQIQSSTPTSSTQIVSTEKPLQEWDLTISSRMPMSEDYGYVNRYFLMHKIPERCCSPITAETFVYKSEWATLDWYNESLKEWHNNKGWTRQKWEYELRWKEQVSLHHWYKWSK